MPPKKSANKKKDNADISDSQNPLLLLSNYEKYSRLIGIDPHISIQKCLRNDEIFPIEQIVVDGDLPNFKPLGPGGTRALMTAVMGNGIGMKAVGPYTPLKFLRFWKANVGDEGTNAICEVLRLGGADVQIKYLELLDCNLSYRSGLSLGIALTRGNNVSLLTLKLDYNNEFGALGVHHLCNGLRSNISLKQLYLKFCGITSEAGRDLADLVANANSLLEILDLSGNQLKGAGLELFCRGLQFNTKLQTLILADNMIDPTQDGIDGLLAFRDCLLIPTIALTSIDLMFNRIGEAGAEVLIPALAPDTGNAKIKEFLIDISVPLPLFEKIFRKGTGKKKKGKKGGKKKKKK